MLIESEELLRRIIMLSASDDAVDLITSAIIVNLIQQMEKEGESDD